MLYCLLWFGYEVSTSSQSSSCVEFFVSADRYTHRRWSDDKGLDLTEYFWVNNLRALLGDEGTSKGKV